MTHAKIERHTQDPVTGLYDPCVAKCNMPRELDQAKIHGRWGTMPDDLLTAIVDAFDKLCADPNFDDWQ